MCAVPYVVVNEMREEHWVRLIEGYGANHSSIGKTVVGW
jgi:hypothetical protein